MLIDVIDEHELINLGIKIGSKTPREFILFKWKEITNENVIEFIKMFSTLVLMENMIIQIQLIINLS
jgi:hypothetical protein